MRIILLQRCRSLRFFFILMLYGQIQAQETFPRNDVKDKRAGQYAFINATLIVDHQTTIENATLIIKDGRIEQAGAGLAVPNGYSVVDIKGKYIYPSLIDMYTSYGLPEVDRRSGGSPWSRAEQIESKTKGAYNANEAIKSHYNAAEEFTANAKDAEELQKAGFGAVLTFREDGLARGTGAFVTLGESADNTSLLRQRASAHYSFNKGTSTQTYPVSLMGFIAVLRQTYLDAEWYGSLSSKPFTDQSLEAWLQTQSLPQ